MLVNIFRPKKTNREKNVFERDFLGTLEIPEEIAKESDRVMEETGDPYFIDKTIKKLFADFQKEQNPDGKKDIDWVFILWLSKRKDWKLQLTCEVDVLW